MKRESDLHKRVDMDVRSRLVDICHINDGSISDLMDVYDIAIKLQNNRKFDDRPSRINVVAYHTTLRYFGYERNSIP